MSPRHRAVRVLGAQAAWLACAAALVSLLMAPAAARATDRLDALVQQAEDAPSEALAQLVKLRPARPDDVAARPWHLAHGLVQARNAHEDAARSSAAWLDDAAVRLGEPLARADAELVRAVLADTAGRAAEVGERAQAAVVQYERLCSGAAPAPRPGCDPRRQWQALMLAAQSASLRGVPAEQQQRVEAALALARHHRDDGRELHSLSALAISLARHGEVDAAARLLAQGERLVALDAGDTRALARLRFAQAWLAEARGDLAAELHLLQEAGRLAQAAGARRLLVQVLLGESDLHVRAARPRQALARIEPALHLLETLPDRRLQRVALHNAALARVSLNQLTQARADFDRLLALWEEGGEGDLSRVLREFADALAAAGDFPGALALYHRERTVSAQLVARNREAALRELQVRYDREAQQRHIELLERDNALKSAQIANRDLLHRVWTLLVLTLAVATAAAVLLYRRVRETTRRLESNQAALRSQSERDPLTGLANRRRFQAAMRERGDPQHFQGTLLLLDIDHFKQVNDRHGHGAGDEVLVEVARRVQEAVRAEDLVVRWGGEEFLVYAAGLQGPAREALVQRLLRAVGERPVAGPDGPLRITASIGHAQFPLPPHALAVSWERALHVVDLALHAAKRGGRNRAAGVEAVHAGDLPALRAVEDDFEGACARAEVALSLTHGPRP